MPIIELTLSDGTTKRVQIDGEPTEELIQNEIIPSIEKGIASNANATQPQPQPQQEAEQKRRIDLTPSGLVDKAGTGLASLIVGGLSPDKTVPEAYQELSKIPSPSSPARNFAFDTYMYSVLGALSGLSKLPFLEGALIGGLEGLKEGNNPLASAVAGGVLGSGIQKGMPIVKQAGSKLAGAYLKSGVPEKLADMFANIPPSITRKVIKNPKILQEGKRAGIIGQDKYYGQQFGKLGEEYFTKLQDYVNSLKNKISDIPFELKGKVINPENRNYKGLLKRIDEVFDKYSDEGISAKEEYQPIVNELKDLYNPEKTKTLYSLNELKENLARKISSNYPAKQSNINVTKWDTVDKITKDIENEIDTYIKARKPRLARAKEEAKREINLKELSNLNLANAQKKIAQYAEENSSMTEAERKALRDLEKMFSENPDILKRAEATGAQSAYNRLSPETSGLTQILTRKAFPYLGMGALGFVGSGLNPLGFMGGIGASGLITSPRFHGKMIKELSEIARNPKTNPETLRRVSNAVSQLIGRSKEPTTLLEGRVEKSNLD